jgi:hypothetical protein
MSPRNCIPANDIPAIAPYALPSASHNADPPTEPGPDAVPFDNDVARETAVTPSTRPPAVTIAPSFTAVPE